MRAGVRVAACPLRAALRAHDRSSRAPTQRRDDLTTDDRHVYYRCPTIAGNPTLAQRPGPEGRLDTLIETRGERGYAIIPPSPPACHPRQRPSVLR